MADQRKMKDWPNYYLERKRKRRSRRLTICGLIIALILLSLFQCRESRSPVASNAPGSGISRTPSMETFQVFVPQRRKFENDQTIRAPWSRELYDALGRRGPGVRACFQGYPSPSFDWWFAYQPSTGRILHREFIWDGEREPGQQTLRCVESILTMSYQTRLADPNDDRWFSLRVRYSDDVGRVLREQGASD